MTRTIAVCGATGQQGSAVVEALLARGGFRIIGLSRTPGGDKAKALTQKGVEMRAADLLDEAALTQAFQGADAVFGVTQPWSADYRKVNVESEIKQGHSLIDACVKAGVKHLMFSTVVKFDDKMTGIPHVDSKFEIERYLAKRSLPYTILRPGTFMDTIGAPFSPVKKGVVNGFTDGDAKVPYIACRDIGLCADAIFAAPDAWIGKSINLIGEFASGDYVCEVLGRLRNERFRYKSAPALLMRIFVPEFYKMRRGIEQMGRPPFEYQKGVDQGLAATRALNPGVWSLQAFLKEKGFATRTL